MRWNKENQRGSNNFKKLTIKPGAYHCEAVDETGNWRFYGLRNTLEQARVRAADLKQKFEKVRIRKFSTVIEVLE